MKSLNWLLYEVHRWLGVVLAIVMLVWFLSGIAIIYATPTTQSRSQQLAHAETLSPENGWLSLGEAWSHSAEQRKVSADEFKAKVASSGESAPKGANGQPDGIADARLVRIGGQPRWLIEDTNGLRFALSALDASLQQISVDEALKIAANWFKSEGKEPAGLSYLETVDNTIILRNQDALRPFHRIASDNGEELLISARTGEVLHASTRLDRGFYYAGNWIHLFKPLDSLGFGEIRHDVQLWSGFTATIACLTGLVIGWLRWRPGFGGKPTYSQGRTQPYREFWFKWHFWTGLIGGTVAFGWALSGYISTNPGKLFSPADYSKAELSRYQGEQLPVAMRDWRPAALNTPSRADIVEQSWRRLGEESVLLAYGRDGQRLPRTPEGVGPRFSEAGMKSALQRLLKDQPLQSIYVQDEYDSYYYPRHHQGQIEKPLPVVVAEFGDEAGSRVYLDPQDGRILLKADASRRAYRWLYSGLHHWDFGWLFYRPIWDVWMLTWVGFGLVLGSSSIVIGWRRLKKTFAPKKTKARELQTRGATLATEAAGD